MPACLETRNLVKTFKLLRIFKSTFRLPQGKAAAEVMVWQSKWPLKSNRTQHLQYLNAATLQAVLNRKLTTSYLFILYSYTWYRDGADNTTEENSNDFSLI